MNDIPNSDDPRERQDIEDRCGECAAVLAAEAGRRAWDALSDEERAKRLAECVAF